MCGIVGQVNFNNHSISPVVLERMRDALVHRGPDAYGTWVKANVGFGHRRLSIVDLSSSGNQPMVCAEGRYVLTYNGEVYNFKELRAELQALGYKFQSDCDTEVVLAALIKWGKRAVARFNGMFAFSFFDCESGMLLLARDRYGIKPLYYCRQNNVFSFASEQKAFFEIPIFERKLNLCAVKEYFTFQNILSDNTLLEGVERLPAGHTLELDVRSKIYAPELEQYWDFNFHTENSSVTYEEYLEETTRLIEQAVNRQLVADVELGSYLSGGVDSGIISAIASRSYPFMKSFTCGFDLSSATGLEQAFDERQAAERLSYLFKTEHYEMVLKAGDMQRSLPHLSYHMEEPRVGQSYPNLYAAKLASKFVKVCFSGVGGDEIFAGYPWRYQAAFNQVFDKSYYQQWQRLTDNDGVASLMSPVANEVSDFDTRSVFRNILRDRKLDADSAQERLNNALYFDAKTFLPGLLHVEDRLSMAFSLEARVPFLDNDLVDFVSGCPLEYRLDQQQHDVAFSGKRVLRSAAEKFMPESIAQARKQGFSAPDASWFKGESIDFVKDQLLVKNLVLFDVLDKRQVERIVKEHASGVSNHRLMIWSLLNFNEYYQQTFESKGVRQFV